VANGIDVVVLIALVSITYGAVAGIVFLLDPHDFDLPRPHLLLTSGLATGAMAAYLTLGWWISGRTPGKQVVGLRLVDGRGGTVGLGKAAVRALACVLFPMGLFWTAFSTRNASAQDLLLGTRVTYDWEKHLGHRPSPAISTSAQREQVGSPPSA
jgi:uncharacterized RDD family membrane protein YckC